MKYFTVKNGKVENICNKPFKVKGQTTHETEEKLGRGYTYASGTLSAPDTTERDKKVSAWKWAIEKLYNGQLAGQSKWITAVKYPHLKQFMSDQDWANLVDAWENS